MVYVKITKPGLALLSKLDEPIRQLHRDQLGHMSQSELRELSRTDVECASPNGDGWLATTCPRTSQHRPARDSTNTPRLSPHLDGGALVDCQSGAGTGSHFETANPDKSTMATVGLTT